MRRDRRDSDRERGRDGGRPRQQEEFREATAGSSNTERSDLTSTIPLQRRQLPGRD